MQHKDIPNDGGLFVFAQLGDFTCSICAPGTATQADVERFATEQLGYPLGGWEAVDKSKAGLGAPSPGPCNITIGRRHWFLLAGLQAAQLGFKTKK